jgi:hypothetical protein
MTEVWPTKEEQDLQLDALLSGLNLPTSQKVQVVAAVAPRPNTCSHAASDQYELQHIFSSTSL